MVSDLDKEYIQFPNSNVLILVLVEDGLWPVTYVVEELQKQS